MAKDDYEVLVFKILTYLYGVAKRKYFFNPVTFEAVICRKELSEEYLTLILKGMKDEGLVEGVTTVKSWGGNYILSSDISWMSITTAGMRYVKENSQMNKLIDVFKDTVGLFGDLVRLVY